MLELLIASALALVILTATFSMFLSSQKDATSLIAKADAAQSTNLGLYEMDEDLRQAYEIEFPVASSTVASGCPETAGVQPCNIIDVLARLPVSGGGYSDYEVRYDCTVTSTTIPTDRACWRYQCPASATTPLTSTCLATTSGVIAKMVIDDVSNGTAANPVFSFCYPATATTGAACGTSTATRPTSGVVTIKTPAAGTLSAAAGGSAETIIFTNGIYMPNLDYNQ